MRPQWLLAVGAMFPLFLGAQETPAQEVSINVTTYTLNNGMTLLIVPRRTSFTFSAYLRVKVGSAQEPAGKTGLSHMLEHMMFKGSRRIGGVDAEVEGPILDALDGLHHELSALLEAERSPLMPKQPDRRAALEKAIVETTAGLKRFIIPNEFMQAYQRQGAVGLNASTSRDGTQYYVSLPSNRLELWATLESDRIRHPVFREFYTERDVVREERRQRYEAHPEGALSEALMALAFAAHPYRNPVIGWSSDIEGLLRPDALRHFKVFYAPNNLVAVLVGNLDPDHTTRIIEERFGAIPPQPPPNLRITQEPPQRGERRVSIRFDAQPRMMIGYRIPALGHPDTYALQVAATIMGSGRTSRFYRGLIDGKRLASAIETSPTQLRDPGLLVISATPRAPHTLEELEKGIDTELDRLRESIVTERELQRVRSQLDADLIRSLRSNASLAAHLGAAQALTGDWHYLLESRKRLKSVTGDDVQRVVRTYLITENRTVATLHSVKP